MERLIESGNISFRRTAEKTCPRIGIGLEKLDRNLYNPSKAYDRLAAIGVHFVRLQSGWMRTEKEKGVYDFSWLDEITDSLISRHMQPWICLCYGNPLYTDRAKEAFGAVGCPPLNGESLEAWLNYVRATVRHFSGRVEYYEIWNEPDGRYSWRHDGYTAENDPGCSGYEYGVFAKATAEAIHFADSNAKAIGFAAAHPNKPAFFEDAFTVPGLAEELDCASFHAYKADDTHRAEHYSLFAEICRQANPKIKIIQGEAGTQSRSDGAGALKRMAWTPLKQRKFLLRELIRDLHDPRVLFTSYFSTMDMVEALNGRNGNVASYLDYGYFGVLGADFDENGFSVGEYTPKPSYYALGYLISIFSDEWKPISDEEAGITRTVLKSVRVGGYDCNDSSLCSLSFRRPDGALAYCYWNAVNVLTSTYEGTVSLRLPKKENYAFRILDPSEGKIYALPDDMVSYDTEKGSVILVNLPVTDSPLILEIKQIEI